jgi:hypothetical protein
MASKPNSTTGSKKLTNEQSKQLLTTLKARFDKHTNRHKGIDWAKIEAKLKSNPNKQWSLNEMEATGGEPDVIGYDKQTDEYIFVDCAAESPKDRRSFCYDGDALAARKENKPEDSAVERAAAMGVELLTEEEYRKLQELGNFDLKTSSWLKTPAEIRKLDGAIFGDKRYNTVFIYHNGVQSYYASRGFRGKLVV